MPYAARTLENEEDLPVFFKDEMEEFLPLSLDTFYSYQDGQGRIIYPTVLEYIVFRSTCYDCNVRRQVWVNNIHFHKQLFLTDVYSHMYCNCFHGIATENNEKLFSRKRPDNIDY